MRKYAFLLLIAVAAIGQQPAHVEPPVYVTAIDLVADVRDASGKLPAGLTAADFVVIEDGVQRTIVGVDYLQEGRNAAAAAASAQPAEAAGSTAVPAAPTGSTNRLWQTVLYFETELSNAMGRQSAARELMKHAESLTRMGTVDVIFANPTPAALVRSSRDPEAIRQALATVAAHPGINQLARGRREYLHELHSIASIADIKRNSPPPLKRTFDEASKPMTDWGKAMDSSKGADGNSVRPFIEQELQMIKRFRSNLLTWMSNYRRHAPRTLMLVTDGFDVDPVEFYASNLLSTDEMTLRSYVANSALSASAQKMAESLAAAGWTTISVPSDNPGDGWVDDASTSAIGRVHGSVTRPAAGAKGQKGILYRPLDPLNWVADDTGGSVVANSSKLGEAIESIDERLRITYQVDRKPDGKPRKVELRAKNPKLKVRSARWAASSTPDEMAEARALAILTDGAFPGELPVETTIEWSGEAGRRKGVLRVAANMDIMKAVGPVAARGDFRLTLAIRVPEKGAFVTNHTLSGVKLDKGYFRLKTPVDFPEGTNVVAVVLEDINSSVWGSSRVVAQ